MKDEDKSKRGGGAEPRCQRRGAQPRQAPNPQELLASRRHTAPRPLTRPRCCYFKPFPPVCCSVMTLQALQALPFISHPNAMVPARKEAFLIIFWFWVVFSIANSVFCFSVTRAKENYIYTYIYISLNNHPENCTYNHSHSLFMTDKNFNWLIFSFIKTPNYNCNGFIDFQSNFSPREVVCFRPWKFMYFRTKSNNWYLPIVTLLLELCSLLLAIWVAINIIIRFLHKALIIPKELQIFSWI